MCSISVVCCLGFQSSQLNQASNSKEHRSQGHSDHNWLCQVFLMLLLLVIYEETILPIVQFSIQNFVHATLKLSVDSMCTFRSYLLLKIMRVSVSVCWVTISTAQTFRIQTTNKLSLLCQQLCKCPLPWYLIPVTECVEMTGLSNTTYSTPVTSQLDLDTVTWVHVFKAIYAVERIISTCKLIIFLLKIQMNYNHTELNIYENLYMYAFYVEKKTIKQKQ